MSVQKKWHNILCTLPILLALSACKSQPAPDPAGYFKVAVIVDTTSDPVSREQAEAVMAVANEKLIDLTGYGLELVRFVEDDSGSSIDSLVEDFMINHENSSPNGIVVFSVGDDDRAKINRAYARQIPAPSGYRNSFVSPSQGDQTMYVGVLQFNYRYAACGYAGSDTIQNQVASSGECRGVDGEACVEWNGMQVCESVLELLEGHTPTDLAAGPVIHEFMHSFSDRGPGDHYGSEACNSRMEWSTDHFDLDESEYYNGMCPDVYDNFANSYLP